MFSGANGSVLLTLEGKSGGDRFGHSVSGAGDFNGDGLADIAVGEPAADHVGGQSGSAYVFSGADGTLLLAAHGDTRGQDAEALPVGLLGHSVAVGDFNGDGQPDLVAATPWDDSWVYRSAQRWLLPAADVLSQSGAVVRDMLGDLAVDVDSSSVGVAVRSSTAPARGSSRWMAG